jgi:Uma2 family endonuclease
MSTVVIADDVRIPAWVTDLASFRRWRRSKSFPTRGRVSWLAGEIWVDMSMEQLFDHNRLKTHITIVLGGFVEREDLGYFLSDRTSYTNPDADVGNEPDAVFCSYEAVKNERVGLIRGKRRGYVEIEGTPDMVLEIVSDSSVRKDTRVLRSSYWRAGIPEYWLIDGRYDPLQFDILRWTERGYQTTRSKHGYLKSRVFGRSFRLDYKTDRLGHPQYLLQIEDLGSS